VDELELQLRRYADGVAAYAREQAEKDRRIRAVADHWQQQAYLAECRRRGRRP
jgi:hypothetical protein